MKCVGVDRVRLRAINAKPGPPGGRAWVSARSDGSCQLVVVRLLALAFGPSAAGAFERLELFQCQEAVLVLIELLEQAVERLGGLVALIAELGLELVHEGAE